MDTQCVFCTQRNILRCPRARESFQVVLNLDSDNELAKRYLQLSRIKFDEMVKHSMLQGSRYREKKNWRLCQSSFFNVMTMLQNRKDDSVYQEAKRYYDECALNTVMTRIILCDFRR